MVVVSVRETYDIATVTGKMTVLAFHTPKPEIIIKNFPGLLMQCKAYRPLSMSVRCACASMLPADVLQVGTDAGDVAPEDMFNPILYKACSNFGMSQIEARINSFLGDANAPIQGDSVIGTTTGVTSDADDFDLYYGLLSDVHQWKHANPQSGFQMSNLKPLVYEMLYSIGDNGVTSADSGVTGTGVGKAASFAFPEADGSATLSNARAFKGRASPMPWINTTIYNGASLDPGFTSDVDNASNVVPAPQIVTGCAIFPPSRLHKLYFRLVCEWRLEFSGIRSINEITNWDGIKALGQSTYLRNYSYSETSKALGVEQSNLVNDVSMASSNVDIKKVM